MKKIRSSAFAGPADTWHIGELPDGVYLLRYSGGSAVLSAMVIIQH